MKSKPFSIFKNGNGFSMVEAVVAVGLSAVVGLGVMSLSQKSAKQATQAEQNLNLDDYTRSLRRYLTDKNSCNSVLSASGADLSADLSSFNATKKPPLDIKEVKVLTPSLTGSGREVVPASLIIYFDRKVESLKNAFAIKRTTAMVEYKDGAFIGCSDYEAESEISTFKMACETMGGSFSLETGAAGSEKCDFSTLAPNHKMLGFAKKYICENVYHGVFDGVKCDSMKMPNAQTTGGNIQPNQFLINGNWVKTFTQLCPDQNSFVKSIKSDGSVDCKTIKFCTKCDANCPASGSLCEGPGPAPASAPELDCDANDNYYIDGLNSASATNYCKFTDYTKNSAGTSCSSSTSTKASAGVCKYFSSGTCDGNRPGVIKNYPDGTSCATNKQCLDGVCVEEEEEPEDQPGEPPVCEDGSAPYNSKSACLSDNPDKECPEVSFLVFTPSMGSGNYMDNLDTSKYPLCNSHTLTLCSDTNEYLWCTRERRKKGESEKLDCSNKKYYCPGEDVSTDLEDPKCPDGSKAYASQSACESANGASSCKTQNMYTYQPHGQTVSYTNDKPVGNCHDMLGKACSSGDPELLCRYPGESLATLQKFRCKNSTLYCKDDAGNDDGGNQNSGYCQCSSSYTYTAGGCLGTGYPGLRNHEGQNQHVCSLLENTCKPIAGGGSIRYMGCSFKFNN